MRVVTFVAGGLGPDVDVDGEVFFELFEGFGVD